MFTFYKVGGCVRDFVLNKPCKDIDLLAIGGSFQELEQNILDSGGKIYVSKPEFLTIRCNHPKIGPCDIRLARKDGNYYDNRHPNEVFATDNLADDINTRDFTCNALLQSVDNDEIIDLVGGLDDIRLRQIKCVGCAADRFKEDSLRLIRAIRFAITLDFTLHNDVYSCLTDLDILSGLEQISIERIHDELSKMFNYNTSNSLLFLEEFIELRNIIFENKNLKLRPTLKEKF